MTVRRAPEAMIFENDGGQCSLERTRLPINSLLSGNFAGSFRETRNLAPLGDGINRGFAGRLGTTLPNTRNREREPSIREGSVGGTLQELARTGQIPAGHARFEAAKLLGLKSRSRLSSAASSSLRTSSSHSDCSARRLLARLKARTAGSSRSVTTRHGTFSCWRTRRLVRS